jgi:hypothetical protein
MHYPIIDECSLKARDTGCYFWLIIASILRFRHQKPGSTARRVLLPYAIVSLLMNSASAVLIFMQEVNYLRHSTVFLIIKDLLAGMPVLINDTLFVSLSLYFFISAALTFHKMYRAAVLFRWRLLPLIIPACIYLTLFGETVRQLFGAMY